MVDYLENHSDHRPSGPQARIAAALVKQHFGDDALVGDLTPLRQEEFRAWCRGKGHSESYIGRTLSVVNAALRRAEKKEELKAIPKIYAQAPSGFREWIPTYEQLGAFIDRCNAEHLFRYVILALNTAARPEAIIDLTRFQVDWARRLIALNPPGRAQNKKHRPTIPASDCLWGWLRAWDGDHFVYYGSRKKRPRPNVKKAFQRIGAELGLPKLNRYSLRHFVASDLRARRVPMDEVGVLLGHRALEHRTTERYTKFDPAYLRWAIEGIDAMMAELQGHAKRRLFADGSTVAAFKVRSTGGGRGWD